MRKRKQPQDITANLTSLIDVTFLLIVFFVLVSRVNEVERIELELPQPKHALTETPEDEHRVVINVLPGREGGIRGYRVGLAEFASDEAGQSAMAEHLSGLYRVNPAIKVNIRADRGTHYEFVEPALQAVSRAARSAAAASGTGTGASPAMQPRINLVVAKEQ